jgi:hypothetical protein
VFWLLLKRWCVCIVCMDLNVSQKISVNSNSDKEYNMNQSTVKPTT